MILPDLEQLVEGTDLEAKAAQGRDGKGELPGNFFETYSAMANTDGGQVLLGVEELADGALRVRGNCRRRASHEGALGLAEQPPEDEH